MSRRPGPNRDEIPFDIPEDPDEFRMLNNQKIEEARKQKLKYIADTCSELMASNPAAWKRLEEAMYAFYSDAQRMDRASPLEMIGRGWNPEFWGIQKAFLRGKLEILESMFSILPLLNPGVPKYVPKTFFQKCVAYFGFRVICTNRIK
jgi:hypothetical protein